MFFSPCPGSMRSPLEPHVTDVTLRPDMRSAMPGHGIINLSVDIFVIDAVHLPHAIANVHLSRRSPFKKLPYSQIPDISFVAYNHDR
ncbi:MAG: hypothetical protein AB4352_17625 [Hormoscilla sp.]